MIDPPLVGPSASRRAPNSSLGSASLLDPRGSFVPGRTLVIAASLGAAGLALGGAREAMTWILAAVALTVAAIVAWRLGRGLEVPATTGQRILLLAGAGVVLTLGVLLSPLGFIGFGALAALLAGASLVEALVSPEATMLDLSRDLPARLSLGTSNEITIKLHSRTPRSLHVAIRDRAPWGLLPRRQPAAFVIRPGMTALHRYEVVPPTRGDFSFEAVDLRLTTFPGLVRRRVAVPLASRTHVYPNLREVARYSLLLHRKRLQTLGLKMARKRGKGTEFETLREYQPDDEYRDISWKASARAGRLITQTWQIERSQNVMILVEAGRMMSAQVADPAAPPEAWLTKLDHSINAALVLAQTAALKEDRVGVLAFADQVKAFLPPKRGRSQLTSVVNALHDLQPTLGEPDFESAFHHLKARAKRRSLVAIFTDLLDEESARLLSATIPLLLPHHLPLVIAVSDPTVSEMATAMPYTGTDAFSGAVAGELLQERKDILRRLRARGALVLDVAPGELSASVVNKYLEVKARNLL